MKALQSEQAFNDAATMILSSALDSLGVVQTAKETYDAYDAVNNIWYTNKKRLPKTSVVIKRDTDVLTSARPWIVPDSVNSDVDPIVLDVPLLNTKGERLTNYYQFTIDLNYKFPVEEIFPDCESRLINQDDFGTLLNNITNELRTME